MPRSNPHTACEDFHRAAVRDPRMEIGVTRRHFLRLGAAAGLSLYAAGALPLPRALEGAQAAAAAAPDAPILVSVFLPGGLDLLDALIPLHQYGAYQDHRGVMAQPDVTTPKLQGTPYGIHPSLTHGDGGGIKGMFERGRLGFVPGISYENADLSHFHSRHYWETGLLTASATTGWMGRWLDTHGNRDNPFQGVTSGHRLSPVLRSSGAPVSSIESVAGSRLAVAGVSGYNHDRVMAAWTDLAFPRSRDSAQQAVVRTTSRWAQDVSLKLTGYGASAPASSTEGGIELPVVGEEQATGYPDKSGFADRLRQLAFLLAQPLGVRVATVDADGDYDTHANQGPVLERELKEISMALCAFQSDIEARGLGDRVLTVVWSEFGRRPRANDSLGTDHGAGGLAWVMGQGALKGIHSEYPDLRTLDNRHNLRVTIDFRQVYASLIEQWLGTDASTVMSNAASFKRVQLTR